MNYKLTKEIVQEVKDIKSKLAELREEHDSIDGSKSLEELNRKFDLHTEIMRQEIELFHFYFEYGVEAIDSITVGGESEADFHQGEPEQLTGESRSQRTNEIKVGAVLETAQEQLSTTQGQLTGAQERLNDVQQQLNDAQGQLNDAQLEFIRHNQNISIASIALNGIGKAYSMLLTGGTNE